MLPARASRAVIVLGLALLAATTLVVVLALQVKQLRADQHWLVDRASNPYPGMYVPRVEMTALDGNPYTLGQPRARRQVLYFFTTTCPHCHNSLPMVKQLAAMRDGDAEMLGIALADPAAADAYARQHRLSFPVIATQDRRMLMLFRARKVPLIMVIGGDGRVRYSRFGVLNSRDGFTRVLSAVRSKDTPGADPKMETTP
jgi:peroxiredoxin